MLLAAEPDPPNPHHPPLPPPARPGLPAPLTGTGQRERPKRKPVPMESRASGPPSPSALLDQRFPPFAGPTPILPTPFVPPHQAPLPCRPPGPLPTRFSCTLGLPSAFVPAGATLYHKHPQDNRGQNSFPSLLCVLSRFSRVQLSGLPWTGAHQLPLSMGFSRQEYRSGLPCPPPGVLPNPGI